ncbi:MAG: glycosyltransferase [Syntrophorhabdaceae bacterium]|nr:glycosyltransferase [Syntrophorhabdaceae bacterium]
MEHQVLFIAYHFPPVGGAGVQRTVGFVKHLPEFGLLPVVVTGAGPDEGRWTPEDQVFMSRIPKEVVIYRTEAMGKGLRENKVSRFLRRLLCLDGPFARWWIPASIKQGEKAIKEQGIRLILATMSPFESAIVAATLSRRFKIPWIADLRDPWALDEMQVYYSSIHRRIHKKRMHNALSSASGIIMNTPEAVRALKKAFPDFEEKDVICITNGFDPQDFDGPTPSRDEKTFRIVHSGYFHTELGMDLERKRVLLKLFGGIDKGVRIITRSHLFLIKALEEAIAIRPEIKKDLEVRFIGIADKTDVAIAKRSPLANYIHFTGYLPHNESVKEIRMADLLFLPMHNIEPRTRATIVPGKLYEYMATEKPIIGAVPEGDAKDFLIKSGLGIIVEPDDEKNMAKKILDVYNAWRKKEMIVTPNRPFIRQFERKRLTEQLAEEIKAHMVRGIC